MTFLDTNVIVYSVDRKNPAKQAIAREIVARAISGQGYVISAQVLNEFSNIALLKLKMDIPEVRKFVSVFSLIKTISLDCAWTDKALTISTEYSFLIRYCLRRRSPSYATRY